MYANWASDPEVARFLTWPTHSSVEVTKSLLADWIPGYEDGGYFNNASYGWIRCIKTKEGFPMIRPVTEKDIPACVEVIRKSFLTVAEKFHFTKENAPRFDMLPL